MRSAGPWRNALRSRLHRSGALAPAGLRRRAELRRPGDTDLNRCLRRRTHNACPGQRAPVHDPGGVRLRQSRLKDRSWHRRWGRRLGGMSTAFPPCPYLPLPERPMDWRDVHAFREERGAELYLALLQYGNGLWQRGLPARALLCLDRAFGTALTGAEPVLVRWPLPYDAMAWLMASTPEGVFIGNPRVHFQHYADRMNEPRREQRRWRAWACWQLSRIVLPHLKADPRHVVVEPSPERIAESLFRHGHNGEEGLWTAACARAALLRPRHVF